MQSFDHRLFFEADLPPFQREAFHFAYNVMCYIVSTQSNQNSREQLVLCCSQWVRFESPNCTQALTTKYHKPNIFSKGKYQIENFQTFAYQIRKYLSNRTSALRQVDWLVGQEVVVVTSAWTDEASNHQNELRTIAAVNGACLGRLPKKPRGKTSIENCVL